MAARARRRGDAGGPSPLASARPALEAAPRAPRGSDRPPGGRVQSEQPPSGSTSGPPTEPRGSGAVCSMAPRDAPPARPAEAAAGREETKPSVARSPRPPGLASATTGAPIAAARRCGLPRRPARRPRCRPRAPRGRSRCPTPATPRGLPAAVGEGDGHLVAAQVVGVREDAALGDDHAGARGPTRGRSRRPRARRARRRRRWVLQVRHGAHTQCSSVVTSRLQVDYTQHEESLGSRRHEPRPTAIPARRAHSAASATAGRC